MAATGAMRSIRGHALHPLLPNSAELVSKAFKGHAKPAWTPKAEELLEKWGKIGLCMSHYQDFRRKTKKRDIKKLHIFMNEKAQARLARFYLCCALRLRPKEVDAAGTDAQRLLSLAQDVAEKDVEPYFEECREFVASYDEGLHRRLDETTVWFEIGDGLFWHHSFEAVSPKAYARLQASMLPPEEEWPSAEDKDGIESTLKACEAAIDGDAQVRELAEDVYQRFLEASKTPVQERMRSALIDTGVIWGKVTYRGKG
eukprot:NODE_15444_length_1049_cov_9.603037.p2 GENE.NODE_15444_length_1049_cov_9.603037~~NODE_15444_length_1049_cov_9.603037.p2  ORF type:complete len:257 (+),score=86.97 NODE_15444_length_1049_cov_9.603037:89-859(+)